MHNTIYTLKYAYPLPILCPAASRYGNLPLRVPGVLREETSKWEDEFRNACRMLSKEVVKLQDPDHRPDDRACKTLVHSLESLLELKRFVGGK